jgi:acyl-CoA hydrolase
MEVRVETYLEYLDGRRKLINRAYLVYVALDENERPTAVPRLELTSAEEEAEWARGVERNKIRQERRLDDKKRDEK